MRRVPDAWGSPLLRVASAAGDTGDTGDRSAAWPHKLSRTPHAETDIGMMKVAQTWRDCRDNPSPEKFDSKALKVI